MPYKFNKPRLPIVALPYSGVVPYYMKCIKVPPPGWSPAPVRPHYLMAPPVAPVALLPLAYPGWLQTRFFSVFQNFKGTFVANRCT